MSDYVDDLRFLVIRKLSCEKISRFFKVLHYVSLAVFVYSVYVLESLGLMFVSIFLASVFKIRSVVFEQKALDIGHQIRLKLFE